MNAKTEILKLMLHTARTVRKGRNLDLVEAAAQVERELMQQLDRAQADAADDLDQPAVLIGAPGSNRADIALAQRSV
jgi:hypothetical protein